MKRQFIAADYEWADFGRTVPAPLFRKSFTLDAVPERAHVTVAAAGFYRLFLNGKDITRGHLAPYVSNTDHCVYSDTYDLVPYLTKGKNVIGILLGNGFRNDYGGITWEFDRADHRGVPCFALEYESRSAGRTTRLSADKSFRIHRSAITRDSYRLGEIYDAREEIADWASPDYDDSAWGNAILLTYTKTGDFLRECTEHNDLYKMAEPPRGDIMPNTAEPLAVLRELKPVSVTKGEDGAYYYDFGINTAGVCRLAVKAEKGQVITLHHFEHYDDDGNFTNEQIGFYRGGRFPFYHDPDCWTQRVIYTAKGEGVEVYTPTFTYFGFRYVRVTGLTDEQATTELLTYLVMSSSLRTLGGFSSSDETVNRVFRAVDNANRSNFFFFPTDCPHREKNGWTGDAAASAEQMTFFYDTEKSYRQWLSNIRKAQNERGELPGIVPTGDWGYAWGNGPAWDRVIVELPYALWRYRGSTAAIYENAEAWLRYFNYILSRRSEDGTVAVGLGDWCYIRRYKGEECPTPLALTDSIMVMDMAKKAGRMLRAIGDTIRAEMTDRVYTAMRDAVRDNLIDYETMTAKGETETAQAMCLYYGIFEPCEEKTAFAKLVEIVHRDGDKFYCGYLGMHVLFHVLAKYGEAELAYEMLMRPEFPSYTYWIERGETGMPENFVPQNDTSSRNHHFMGDVARFYVAWLAGLHVKSATSVEFHPRFVGGLTHAEASYELPTGRVSIAWQKDGDAYRVKTEIPTGVTVEYDLPENAVLVNE